QTAAAGPPARSARGPKLWAQTTAHRRPIPAPTRMPRGECWRPGSRENAAGRAPQKGIAGGENRSEVRPRSLEMVRMRRLELLPPLGDQILSLARLPISPHPQALV